MKILVLKLSPGILLRQDVQLNSVTVVPSAAIMVQTRRVSSRELRCERARNADQSEQEGDLNRQGLKQFQTVNTTIFKEIV